MNYPGGVYSVQSLQCAGRTLTYGFDAMRWPVSLADNASPAVSWVSGAIYNAAGLMTQIVSQAGTENRGYNSRMQLTQINAPGIKMSYVYSATQNNGQITQAVDGVSGETITYQYDTLKRLVAASATGSSTWM